MRAVREAAATAAATKESVATLNLSLQLDAIMRLDATLNSPRMLKARVAVARAFRAGDEPPDDLEDVFDLFESIGLLWRKNALEDDMVRSFFATWVLRYALAHEDCLRRVQLDEPAVWRNVRRLFDALLALEERKTGESRDTILARERNLLPAWMKREASLLRLTPRRRRPAPTVPGMRHG